MTQNIDFIKMHGLGNDFVVVDGRQHAFAPTEDQACFIANRRWGIGCDQLIVLEPSDQADLFMRIYNSDGSQAEACGNATRCVAGLLSREGVNAPTIETLRGVLEVHPAQDDMFTVNMGAPIFDPALIPVEASDPFSLPEILTQFEAPVSLSMGNPHCVYFADTSLVDDVTLQSCGQMTEVHPMFPARTNVHFVSIEGPSKIRQRVFERGAGITGASGSGACAGAVACLKLGKVKGRVEVQLDSGSLWIEWAGGETDPVYMTGPWAESYRGTFPLDASHG